MRFSSSLETDSRLKKKSFSFWFFRILNYTYAKHINSNNAFMNINIPKFLLGNNNTKINVSIAKCNKEAERSYLGYTAWKVFMINNAWISLHYMNSNTEEDSQLIFVVNMLYNTVENYPPSQVNQHKELFYTEKCLMWRSVF